MNPTDQQIRMLRCEATEAGDAEMEAICVLALGGRDEMARAERGTAWGEMYASGMTQEQALAECGRVIEAAAAMQD